SYFNAQVSNETDLPLGGTYNPTIQELLSQYQNQPIGTLTTTYTVTTTSGEESVVISVEVIQSQTAEAGTIADRTVACGSTDIIILDDSILSNNATPGGTFSADPGVLNADGNFDPTSLDPDTYLITYTVIGSECVTGEDSVTFEITIPEGDFEDNPVIGDVCYNEIENPTVQGFRTFFSNLVNLNTDLATGGSFDPTMETLVSQYENDPYSIYNTTYSVPTECGTASVDLAITVLENPDAGQDGNLIFAVGETDAKDLFTGLNGTPETGGTWTDSDGNEVDGSFDPTTDTPGVYTYTLTNVNDCSASATVTVTVEQDTTACPDVTDTTPDFCPGATVAQLEPADANWYDTADGTTPLSDDTALTDGGVYYAGDAAGECPARVMVTVTILDAPAAPTVADFSDCVVTGATVADLDITPDTDATFTVYTDAALQTPAADTDLLVDGTYYVTQTSAAGCESPAAELDVTLTDSNAPTLVAGGNVFCEFDRATLADLEENVNANGSITWYTTATGDETYSTSEVLSNNVTYYASVTPNGDCESSQRLVVTVTLESCDIVIPEIFSPNGDSINDTFVVKNLAAEYPNYKMEIYNRWGEPVYMGNASTPAWDGTSTEGSFGDGVLPVGVYFYLIYFNDGQTAPVQGRLYLSR
ncbi:gliding motility-associated C-terminal domain-containing protein, partial [Salinimicrobium soli]|uniref:gliding motility-associated C-terminal domain-containing protein n=1 Tax=Salinimicrobium soli TaxID=1254399 RepID=UPI003AAC71F7